MREFSLCVPVFLLGNGKLTVVQFGVEAALRQQALVIALFDDITVLHHQNDIRFLDGGQSVGDDKACSALHHGGKGVLDL